MERGSDKHSARVDDALGAEVEGMVRSGRETRGEQWHSAEPSGEDQPDVDLAPDGTLAGGVPDGMTEADVEQRAQIASYLGKEVWPAGSQALVAKATELGAPDDVVDQLRRLPSSAVFDNVQDVWQALQGGTEAHRF
ncbi:MAG TPA: DUF2795 domain-containing protein [Mycobacteriales bacterium]|nr:DUF2795 domain-containing protein [Mycobacteriales bacterium]